MVWMMEVSGCRRHCWCPTEGSFIAHWASPSSDSIAAISLHLHHLWGMLMGSISPRHRWEVIPTAQGGQCFSCIGCQSSDSLPACRVPLKWDLGSRASASFQ